MPGIITSSRIASGWCSMARASPCAPELATTTSHPATVSRLSAATSRISFFVVNDQNAVRTWPSSSPRPVWMSSSGLF